MSIEISQPTRCQDENTAGIRCVYGAGHKEACRFRPYEPTDAQWAVLEDAAKVKGIRRRVCVGTGEVASFKALHRRGYLNIRYINSRAWDISLTPTGMDLLIDRPR